MPRGPHPAPAATAAGNRSPSARSRPWRVWCLVKDQHAHIRPVEDWLRELAEFTYDDQWNPQDLIEARPDIVLCVNDYPYDVVRCLDAARLAGIPSLTLQDGILEWRCQFENPLFGAGGGAPQHQPVIADKIACIGSQSARQIASWGNADKVEITGMPRLDALLKRKPKEVRRPGNCLLVMTAKNPGFTAAQRDVTIRSLIELKEHLDTLRDLEVLWRVSRVVAEALRVDNQMTEVSTMDLAGVVERADAVVSTFSTAMAEAMLLGRPVAVLDYHNVPRLVPTAWAISSREQIVPVIQELREPCASKMVYQQACLDDTLRHDGAAAGHLVTLMHRMIEEARCARQLPVRFPPHLLGDSISGNGCHALPLAELYPKSAVFAERDVEALQVRLARAENENARLKAENETLRLPTRIIQRVKRLAGRNAK